MEYQMIAISPLPEIGKARGTSAVDGGVVIRFLPNANVENPSYDSVIAPL
jgi:hypothetical protein